MASTIILDDDGNLRIYDEEEGYKLLSDEEGTPFYQDFDRAIAYFHPDLASEIQQVTGRSPNFSSYQVASQAYSSGKVPWNYTNVYEGLSNRENFNLNALWGGTQYGAGRVSDFSHLDPTQLQANQIAGQTRDELWRVYDDLKAKGQAPAKNPDQIALDFYTQNVGQAGSTYGYGPGANTALLAESLKSQFLNQPEVVAQTKTVYQPTQEALTKAEAFGASHQAGVPTWQVFEQQGQSSDWFSKLIPAIIGTIAFPGLSAAFGGGLLGGAGAGALIGGTTAEIGGGDFLKGALTGGVGGAISGLNPSVVTNVAESLNIPVSVAQAATNAGSKAVMAGLSGGDVESAILSSLVSSGVGSGLSAVDAPENIAKIISPVVSTAILGGDTQQALISSLIKGGLSEAKDMSWGVNEDLTSQELPKDWEFLEDSDVTSPYYGLDYTPEDIIQLEQGTYAGNEQPESVVQEQMGNLYNIAYPDEFPTSSSAYEGLGYDANKINEIQGLQNSIEEYKQQGFDQNTATQLAIDDLGNRMDLTAQDVKDISDQFQTGIQGVYDQLGITTSNLQSAIDSLSYNQKLELDERMLQGQRLDQAIDEIQQGIDTRFDETKSSISNIGKSVSGIGSVVAGVGSTLSNLQKSINAQNDAARYQDAMNSLANMSQQPQGGGIGIKGALAPQMIGGRAETAPIADYAAIIPKLAGIINQRGYKVGGQVNETSYVAGPEGKLYASHPVRGFAVGGPGTGQSDDIPTMLSDGEYVIDADTVAALGDGSSKAGAEILDKFRQEIRSHKRSAPADKIPPKAKNPLAYLKSAKKSKG